MTFLENFCRWVALVRLGNYYPIYFFLATLGVSLIFLCLLIFFKQLGKLSKCIIIFLLPTAISVCSIKIICDYIYGNPPNVFAVAFAISILPVLFVILNVAILIKPKEKAIYNSEKQLIQRLLADEEPNDSLLTKEVFSNNPFKRIEYLTTQKGFFEYGFNDFSLNPSYIEKCINDLLNKPLTFDDKMEVEHVLDTVQKYKLKNLSNYERDVLSTNLQKLIKLTAKYDKANNDLL